MGKTVAHIGFNSEPSLALATLLKMLLKQILYLLEEGCQTYDHQHSPPYSVYGASTLYWVYSIFPTVTFHFTFHLGDWSMEKL